MTDRTVPAGTGYAGEVAIDRELVAALVAAQFPQWADLPIAEFIADGTDNKIYRLGDDKAVRLPRLARAADMVATELHWLPRLGPHLPLDVPRPLGTGVPDDRFPYPWWIYQWIGGQNLVDQPPVDLAATAVRLGRFVAALQRVDPAGGPVSTRTTPITSANESGVRGWIQRLGAHGLLDIDSATAIWERARSGPAWSGRPVWIHGDLYPGNLLAQRGQLTAVIDFGLLGLGDPACDLLPAWALLTADTRELFRAQIGVDDATWSRGRAWALCAGLGAVDFYRNTNATLALPGQHAITEAIADYQQAR